MTSLLWFVCGGTTLCAYRPPTEEPQEIAVGVPAMGHAVAVPEVAPTEEKRVETFQNADGTTATTTTTTVTNADGSKTVTKTTETAVYP